MPGTFHENTASQRFFLRRKTTDASNNKPKMPKVALIGSGNWGSAIATKIGVNVLDESKGFDKGEATLPLPPAGSHRPQSRPPPCLQRC